MHNRVLLVPVLVLGHKKYTKWVVVKTGGLCIKAPGYGFQLWSAFAVWPWASYFTVLCLHLLIYEMDDMVALTPHDCYVGQMWMHVTCLHIVRVEQVQAIVGVAVFNWFALPYDGLPNIFGIGYSLHLFSITNLLVCLLFSLCHFMAIHSLCDQQSENTVSFAFMLVTSPLNIAQSHINFIAAISHRSLMNYEFIY